MDTTTNIKEKKIVELDSSVVDHGLVERALKDRGCCERAYRTYLHHGPNCTHHGRDPPSTTTERIKLPSKEDAVIDSSGVSDRKLALEIARLEKESKQQMKMLTREANELRKIGRDVRRHSFEKKCLCSKFGAKLPPINGSHNCSHSLHCSADRGRPSSPWCKQVSTDSLISLPASDNNYKSSLLDSRRSPKLHHSSSLPDTLNAAAPSITVEDTSTKKVTTVLSITEDSEGQLHEHRQRCVGHIDCHSKTAVEINHLYNRRARTPEQLRRSKNICHLVCPNVSHRKASQNRFGLEKNYVQSRSNGSNSRSSLDPRFQRLESLLVPNNIPSVQRQNAEDKNSKTADVEVKTCPDNDNQNNQPVNSNLEKYILKDPLNLKDSNSFPGVNKVRENSPSKQKSNEVFNLTVEKERQRPHSANLHREKRIDRPNSRSDEPEDYSAILRRSASPRLEVSASESHSSERFNSQSNAQQTPNNKRGLMKRQKAQSSSYPGGMSPRTIKRVSFKTISLCDESDLARKALPTKKQDRCRSNTH